MSEQKTQEFEIVTVPTALEAIERANVDLQIATAKRYPRHLAEVKKRMLEYATLDQETAASCFYKLSRQGRIIEGPSVRLAEIASSCFGNLKYGARIISNDGKVITGQAYCHDLETNVFGQIESQRRITDKYGKTYSDDMQVVTGNAACAIAFRNAVFKVVPFALVKPILAAAKKVAVGDAKTLKTRRDDMLHKFAELGVKENRICQNLNRAGVDEIGLDDLETLIGLYNAIKETDITIDEAFPIAITRAKIPKTLSDSKELRQVPDTSEGGEKPDVLRSENRQEESGLAQNNLPVSAPTEPKSLEATRDITEATYLGSGEAGDGDEAVNKAGLPENTESPGGQESPKKKGAPLKLKKKIAAPSEPTPYRDEMLKFLAIGQYKPEHLIAVCRENDWLSEGEEWPLPEARLKLLLDEDNKATLMAELEALPR